MGVQEETLRLKTEVDASGAQAATYAFAELDDTVQRLAAVAPEADRELRHLVDVLSRKEQIYAFADEVERVDDFLAKLKADADRVADSVGKVGAGAGKAAAGTRDVGNAALQASRAIEDLQYGFAGVVNNIPGVVQALGGPAGLVGAFSLAFIAINQLINHWGDVKALFQEQNPFPEAADKAKALEATLKDVGDQLDTLRGKQTLTNSELKKFNELTAEQTKLEREQEVERAKAKQKKEKGEEAEGIVSDVNKAVASVGYEEALARLTDAIHKANPSRGLGFNGKEAERLLAEAGAGNDLAADQVKTAMTGAENRFAYELDDPGRKRAKEREALRARVAEKERREAEAAQKKRDQQTDELNELGARYQAEGKADQAKKDEADRKRAESKAKKADEARRREDDRHAADYLKRLDPADLKRLEARQLALQAGGMDPIWAQSRAHGEFVNYLRGRDRNLSEDQAARVSNLAGQHAAADLGRRQNQLAGMGLNLQQQTLQITGDLNREVFDLQAKLLHLEAEVRRQRSELSANRRSVQSRGKP